jgi:hypothetical protein
LKNAKSGVHPALDTNAGLNKEEEQNGHTALSGFIELVSRMIAKETVESKHDEIGGYLCHSNRISLEIPTKPTK